MGPAVTVPMEGLTNRQSRAVIAEDEDRAAVVLAEQRAVYGDPAELERERMQATRRTPGEADLPLTRPERDALIRVLQPLVDGFYKIGAKAELRSVLGKLRRMEM